MTYYGYRAYLQGLNVYSNYRLNFPYKPLSCINDILGMKDGLVLLDDLEAWLSSRNWKSKENTQVMSIILQGGKRNLTVLYSAKRPENIDVLLRDTTDYWCRCSMVPNFIASDILDFEEKANNIENLLIKLEVFDDSVNLVNTTFIGNLDLYCKLYSSYEEISKLSI